MDPVFTLPYSEYAVVEKITKHLGKRRRRGVERAAADA
jgi:hypothetical protein